MSEKIKRHSPLKRFSPDDLIYQDHRGDLMFTEKEYRDLYDYAKELQHFLSLYKKKPECLYPLGEVGRCGECEACQYMGYYHE